VRPLHRHEGWAWLGRCYTDSVCCSLGTHACALRALHGSMTKLPPPPSWPPNAGDEDDEHNTCEIFDAYLDPLQLLQQMEQETHGDDQGLPPLEPYQILRCSPIVPPALKPPALLPAIPTARHLPAAPALAPTGPRGIAPGSARGLSTMSKRTRRRVPAAQLVCRGGRERVWEGEGRSNGSRSGRAEGEEGEPPHSISLSSH
jgi:hypothetical protein